MGDAMKFVFCEGKDDVAVLRSLASHLKLDVQVEEYGGKSNLANFLRTLSTRPEFVRQQVVAMAVLRDADADAAATFTSVRDTLLQNNFAAPDADGTFKEAAPRVGVFIVGVNGRGMIEDLSRVAGYKSRISNWLGFSVCWNLNSVSVNSSCKDVFSKG